MRDKIIFTTLQLNEAMSVDSTLYQGWGQVQLTKYSSAPSTHFFKST